MPTFDGPPHEGSRRYRRVVNVPGGWESILVLSAVLALLACVIWKIGSLTARRRRRPAVPIGRLSPTLVVLAVVVALWPVRADAARHELESGAQPAAQLEARLADPAQRPRLMARPLCMPLLAPLLYTQDTSLRRGCAGPNGRSMSIAFVLLLIAGAGAARERRREAEPQHQLE